MTDYIQKDPNAPSLKADFIRAWLIDLYYKDLKQAQGMLVTKREETFSYCCLGVGCLVYGHEPEENAKPKVNKIFSYGFDNAEHYLPSSVSKLLGVVDNIISFKKVSNEVGKLFPHTKETKLRSGSKNYEYKYYSEESYNKTVNLAELNDTMGFTFVEIAVVLHTLIDSFIPNLTAVEISYIKETKLEGKHNVEG